LADELHPDARNNAELFHSMFQGPLISAAAYTPASGAETIEKGHADAIAFGRSFIANPDLVERIAGGYPLTPYPGFLIDKFTHEPHL
jgi:N-ethylmaleimide reductase